MNFIGVPFRSLGEGLLREAEMSQRQLNQGKPPPVWMTTHDNWHFTSHCMTYRQLSTLASVSSRQLGGSGLSSSFCLYKHGGGRGSVVWSVSEAS